MTGNGLIFGTVEGELYTEKLYDGRRVRIDVLVRFTALEGAFSCHWLSRESASRLRGAQQSRQEIARSARLSHQ
jgi:hypothetical protein